MKLIQYSNNNKIDLGVRFSTFPLNNSSIQGEEREDEMLVIKVATVAVSGGGWWPAVAETSSSRGAKRETGQQNGKRALGPSGGRWPQRRVRRREGEVRWRYCVAVANVNCWPVGGC